MTMPVRTPFRPWVGGKKVSLTADSQIEIEKPLDIVAWMHIRNQQMIMGQPISGNKFGFIGGRRSFLPGGGQEDEVAALVRLVREQVGVEIDAPTAYLVHVFALKAKMGRRVRIACYSAEGLGLPTKNPAVLTDMRYLGSKDKHLIIPVCGEVLEWLKALKAII